MTMLDWDADESASHLFGAAFTGNAGSPVPADAVISDTPFFLTGLVLDEAVAYSAAPTASGMSRGRQKVGRGRGQSFVSGS